jgi:hypothetical protein
MANGNLEETIGRAEQTIENFGNPVKHWILRNDPT